MRQEQNLQVKLQTHLKPHLITNCFVEHCNGALKTETLSSFPLSIYPILYYCSLSARLFSHGWVLSPCTATKHPGYKVHGFVQWKLTLQAITLLIKCPLLTSKIDLTSEENLHPWTSQARCTVLSRECCLFDDQGRQIYLEVGMRLEIQQIESWGVSQLGHGDHWFHG